MSGTDQRRDEAARAEQVLRLGLAGNTALAVLKLAVGWVTGSRALVADGWHSLSDILTNAGVLLAHRWAKTPPDEDHHYGHGNTEALAGVVVGLILMGGGVGVAWSALTSDARLSEGAGIWAALGMAVLSIVTNLGLAVITRRAARDVGSHGMAALARDNASDALAGVLVILGILGARTGFTWAEPAVAVVIGALIVFMGFTSVRDGIGVLMDRVADPELRERLRETVLAVDGVREVAAIRVHPLGPEVRVDMEIAVDGQLTVAQGHEIAHFAEREVTRAHSRVKAVHVHVNPVTPTTADDSV